MLNNRKTSTGKTLNGKNVDNVFFFSTFCALQKVEKKNTLNLHIYSIREYFKGLHTDTHWRQFFTQRSKWRHPDTYSLFNTFNITFPVNVFYHLTLCPIRRFLYSTLLSVRVFYHLTLCSMQHLLHSTLFPVNVLYVLFNVLSRSAFITFVLMSFRHYFQFDVLSFRCFLLFDISSDDLVPFDVFSVDVFYRLRFLRWHFVGESYLVRTTWRQSIILDIPSVLLGPCCTVIAHHHRWACLLKQQMSVTVFVCRPRETNFRFPLLFAEKQTEVCCSHFSFAANKKKLPFSVSSNSRIYIFVKMAAYI